MEGMTLWHPDPESSRPDTHVGFRASFSLPQGAEIEVRLLGASWFSAWLDGELLGDGPARFTLPYPEYQPHRVRLKAGPHALAVQVHHFGVPTRLLDNPPPFLWAAVFAGRQEIPLAWRCILLGGYKRTGRRINAQLGWSEFCDTRQVPLWQIPGFDDSGWAAPVDVRVTLGPVRPLSTATVLPHVISLKPLAHGTLTETFGYEDDNPQARFFLRDLKPKKLPAQGVWRRYDLGRVRLARPRLTLDLPAGAVVEFPRPSR